MPDASTAVDASHEIAFLIPLEKFVYRLNGGWNLSQPVGEKGIVHVLSSLGLSPSDSWALIKNQAYTSAYGIWRNPGAPAVFVDPASGRKCLNTYSTPQIVAAPGAYPNIERVIDHLTGHDPAGAQWLVNWLAAKVQDPALLPMTAVVFATSPGAGKGTLAAVIQELLGEDNCATVSRAEIENKFNSRWVDRLFVFADEVISTDNARDISQSLKLCIAGSTLERHAKHEKQFAVPNRTAWMFASNDRITPVMLETGDRRYSVFANHEPVKPEYKAALDALFEADRTTKTPAFRAEIAAFLHDLKAHPVDRAAVATPYANEAREELIEASRPAHELFFRAVDEGQLDELLEAAAGRDFQFLKNRAEWDFGEKGVATTALYRAYVEFCSRSGARALKINRFGIAIKNHTNWVKTRPVGPSKNQHNAYVVPRNPAPPTPLRGLTSVAQ